MLECAQRRLRTIRQQCGSNGHSYRDEGYDDLIHDRRRKELDRDLKQQIAELGEPKPGDSVWDSPSQWATGYQDDDLAYIEYYDLDLDFVDHDSWNQDYIISIATRMIMEDVERNLIGYRPSRDLSDAEVRSFQMERMWSAKAAAEREPEEERIQRRLDELIPPYYDSILDRF